MSTYTTSLDITGAFALPDACPGCGSGGLVASVDDERTTYRCGQCGAVWHDELGWMSRVDPRDCAPSAAPPDEG